MESIARVQTGVPGLDDILEGGLLKGGVYMVQGPPGAGKTILGNQVCFHNAKGGGQAVYITLLAESHTRMLGHLQRLAFFDAGLVARSVYYMSGFKVLENEGLSGLLRSLRDAIASRHATVLVLDGFVSAEEASPTPKDFKKFIHELQSVTAMTGCTALLLGSSEKPTLYHPEHTMVDGIIEVSDELVSLRAARRIRVRKMRGADQVRGQHTLEIRHDGIHVWPRIETLLQKCIVRDKPPPSNERVPLGVEGLDTMLRGGVPRTSSTMLVGPTGSGKTTFGLHYMNEGARRGEPGLFFGFHERPEALFAKARTLGMNLEDASKRGLVRFSWQPAVEGAIDILGERLIRGVEQIGAKRLFIDGLLGLQRALDGAPDRVREVYNALAECLEGYGVTTVYVLESPNVVGNSIDVPMIGISALTQNAIALRHIEQDFRLTRALTILKVRDGDYEPTTRELRIGSTGIVIGDVLSVHSWSSTERPIDPNQPGTQGTPDATRPPRAPTDR